MDNQLKIYLDEIAEQLWNNKAGLFVGSGFSLNANTEKGTDRMPMWADLGDLFYKKLHGKNPSYEDKAYLNILKLAEDVESVFDRATLNDIIIKAIADEKRTPSDLYYKMLSLPWVNIYTTNYDSLLERSATELHKKGRVDYTIFEEEKSLSTITSPYIAKLHGSLNHPDSMIITEEDYRRYHNRHSIFVNEVRNAFVRNTIVVIGFSADDPNFIQWIGWVHDNLEAHARKIYLISVSDIPEERVTSLSRKNIKVVNISKIFDKSDPYESLNTFFTYLDDSLNEKKTEEESFSKGVLKWGRTNASCNSREKDYKTLYEIWHNDRLTYPGWIVMPRDKREYILNMNQFILSKDLIEQLKRPYDILFLNEFNWRIEKCLFPIYNDWESIYISVINKYDPINKSSDNEFIEHWFNLKLAILRLYRQENWIDKWTVLKEEINSNAGILTKEQLARFKYELCLHAVYTWDFLSLKIVLDNWSENMELPYWEMKKAALWAEFLSLERGRSIAEKAFAEISSKYDSCALEDKYCWASQKNAAHSILNLMNSADFSCNKESHLSAQKTWADTKIYDDFWYERDFFDARLRNVDSVFAVSSKSPQFELGLYRVTTSLGGNSSDYRNAYAFYNYYEELGYPIHLPGLTAIKKETLASALSLMAYCSQTIAEAWMFRFADINLVAFVFSRKKLEFTSFDKINELFEKYLRLFQMSFTIEDSNDKYWISNMRIIIPEILSRLCVKANFELRVRAFDIITELYRSTYIMLYRGIDELISRIMNTFTDEEKYKLIPRFLEMDMSGISNDTGYRYDPMSYISDSKQYVDLHIDSKIISKMIEKIYQDQDVRSIYVTRMAVLYRLDLLNATQVYEFAEALWKHTTNSGFPLHTIYSEFAFLNLPHPDNINPAELLSKYFETHKITYNAGKSISMHVRDQVVNNIKGTLNDAVCFEWESNALEKLVSDIYTAWSHDKDKVLNQDISFGISIGEEYRSKFIDIGRIISGVLAKNQDKLSSKSSDILKHIIDEYSRYALPVYSIMLEYPNWYNCEDLIADFCKRISSYDKFEITDCLVALIHKSKRKMDIKCELEYVTDNFRCNNEVARIDVIQTISSLIIEVPTQFSDKSIQNIILGLKYIYESSKIEISDSELIVNEKLNIRREVAPIVSALLQMDGINDNETLSTWYTYYNDDNTFNDVKEGFVFNKYNA